MVSDLEWRHPAGFEEKLGPPPELFAATRYRHEQNSFDSSVDRAQNSTSPAKSSGSQILSPKGAPYAQNQRCYCSCNILARFIRQRAAGDKQRKGCRQAEQVLDTAAAWPNSRWNGDR